MEAISTIILLASLAGMPITSLRNITDTRRNEALRSEIDPPTRLTFGSGEISTEIGKFSLEDSSGGASYAQNVFGDLSAYADLLPGWDGEGSKVPHVEDIERANKFLTSIPSSIPLPRAMLSAKGEIGLYWNTESVYADIAFDNDGTIFIYTRDRSHSPALECFYEGVEPENVAAWSVPLLDLLMPLQFAA